MKILATGIHIDDIEVGMGGIIAQLVALGHEVICLNIKPYQHYKPRNAVADTQSMRGSQILGAKKIILDYSGTKYYKTNEQTVRACENVIKDVKPDIIFIMNPKDNHIEHVECALTLREAIFAAAVDQVYPNEIYSYECGPLQTMCYFVPDLYININEVEEKLRECVCQYAVQAADGERLWLQKEKRARFRGIQFNGGLAEGLRIIKYPNDGNDFYLRTLLAGKFQWAGTRMYYPKSGLDW